MEIKRYIGLRDVHHGPQPRTYPVLAPLRYLRIQAPAKHLYDYVLPAAGALGLALAYFILDLGSVALRPDGLLSSIQSLLVMAVPFLIGALATVAMASPVGSLDARPVGAEIALDGRVLSLRQFVCYLLGYLSFVGFVLLLMIFALRGLSESVIAAVSGHPFLSAAIEYPTVGIFAWAISSFCLTTLWALYFLTDVVNRR